MAGYFFRYVAPMIGKNLTKKRNILDDLIKSRDKQLSGVRDEAKVEIKSKNPLSKFTKKIEKIVDKKAKGGRVGLKRGTGLKRKSNVEKIKETFSPKNKIKFDAKKSDLDKSGDLSKYEKARGMAIAKAMAKRKNKKVI